MNMIHSKSASGYKRTCYFTYTLPHPELPKRDEWTRYRLMLDHVTVFGGRRDSFGMKPKTQCLKNSVLLAMGFLMVMAALGQSAHALDDDPTVFRRIPTQFIAALGDPGATSGSDAQLWGLWRRDPGPRGVRLANYEKLKAANGVAPARWKFDSTDWWLEENGLIMEPPDYSVPAGKYVVTGNREVESVLTIHPADEDGTQRWELDDGATLYDVTHLRCRSARYTSTTTSGSCSPANAQMTAFPVTPGGLMPPVEGCNKQDYTVLFIVGVAVEN